MENAVIFFFLDRKSQKVQKMKVSFLNSLVHVTKIFLGKLYFRETKKKNDCEFKSG